MMEQQIKKLVVTKAPLYSLVIPVEELYSHIRPPEGES